MEKGQQRRLVWLVVCMNIVYVMRYVVELFFSRHGEASQSHSARFGFFNSRNGFHLSLVKQKDNGEDKKQKQLRPAQQMSKEVLLYERRGRVALLTLNRPDRLNALNAELLAAIIGAIKRANADSEVSVW